MALDLCSSNMPNAGVPLCDKSRGIPRYLIIGDYEFTTGDVVSIAAFKAAFAVQCLVSRNGSGKLIVLPLVTDVQNQTGDNQTGTLNQGFTEVLREGFPAFQLGVQISNNHAQQLRPLNNTDVKVFVVDHNLNVWGAITPAGKFRGESGRLFIGGDNFTDGQNSKTIPIYLSYTDIEEFKASSRYFTIDFSVKDYGQLRDGVLTLVSSTTNVHNITLKFKTGKIGLSLDAYPDYATALANAARWVAKNTATGAAFTITSVATNAAGYWVVTLDSTMWTALASLASVTLNLAAPSVLDAAGATKLEGVEIILTKP
jgi:hypothetical protein